MHKCFLYFISTHTSCTHIFISLFCLFIYLFIYFCFFVHIKRVLAKGQRKYNLKKSRLSSISSQGSNLTILFPSHHFQFHLPYKISVLTTGPYLSPLYLITPTSLHHPFSSYAIFIDSLNNLSKFPSSDYFQFREIQDWLFHRFDHVKNLLFFAGSNEHIDFLE